MLLVTFVEKELVIPWVLIVLKTMWKKKKEMVGLPLNFFDAFSLLSIFELVQVQNFQKRYPQMINRRATNRGNF